MKKILCALFATLLFCSCGGNKAANQICHFIEEATEKTEKATTLNEIKTINEKLTQNIAIYSLSLTEEEYNEWANDSEANKKIQEAEFEYKTAKAAREKMLTGK